MKAPTLIALGLITATVAAAAEISSYVFRSVPPLESVMSLRLRTLSSREFKLPITETTYTFTPGQQMMLLSLRKEPVATLIVTAMKARGDRMSEADAGYLKAQHLVDRNKVGWHILTPQGHWQANRLAAALAKSIPVHHVTTRGDSWGGYTARCTCGWSHFVWKHGRDPYSQILRVAAEHELEAMNAGAVTASSSPAEQSAEASHG